MDAKSFYKILRTGKMITTSAVSIDRFLGEFEPVLKEGKDILYLGFSSGLSGTYNAGAVAAGELAEKYPERKVFTVDTLAASMGQGLLVWYAANMKKKGASIEEVRDFAEENKLKLAHWFTVNDLFFLKRGGRVSAATAILGTALQIKPVLHVDDAGKLISVSKVRGRKSAVDALFAKIKDMATDVSEQTVFISHGDCIEDAEYLAEKIKSELGVKEVVISYVGPVIGAHSGPGTLALFFMATKR
jgi:DegV family protein with EDD domain